MANPAPESLPRTAEAQWPADCQFYPIKKSTFLEAPNGASRKVDFSRALQFFTIGIIRPQDFLAATRSFYEDPYLISMSMKSGLKGLNSSEEGILDIVAPEPESVLVLGCAAGREAIALAKRGWQVVGVDNVSILIDGAKRNAIRSGVQIDWHCLDITRGIPLRQSFDLISLSI